MTGKNTTLTDEEKLQEIAETSTLTCLICKHCTCEHERENLAYAYSLGVQAAKLAPPEN